MSIGCYYGPLKTWKVVYIPRDSSGNVSGGIRGVAFVEADCEQQAMHAFMEQYRGQYFTVESCKVLV